MAISDYYYWDPAYQQKNYTTWDWMNSPYTAKYATDWSNWSDPTAAKTSATRWASEMARRFTNPTENTEYQRAALKAWQDWWNEWSAQQQAAQPTTEERLAETRPDIYATDTTPVETTPTDTAIEPVPETGVSDTYDVRNPYFDWVNSPDTQKYMSAWNNYNDRDGAIQAADQFATEMAIKYGGGMFDNDLYQEILKSWEEWWTGYTKELEAADQSAYTNTSEPDATDTTFTEEDIFGPKDEDLPTEGTVSEQDQAFTDFYNSLPGPLKAFYDTFSYDKRQWLKDSLWAGDYETVLKILEDGGYGTITNGQYSYVPIGDDDKTVTVPGEGDDEAKYDPATGIVTTTINGSTFEINTITGESKLITPGEDEYYEWTDPNTGKIYRTNYITGDSVEVDPIADNPQLPDIEPGADTETSVENPAYPIVHQDDRGNVLYIEESDADGNGTGKVLFDFRPMREAIESIKLQFYETDETGQVIYDENGNPVLKDMSFEGWRERNPEYNYTEDITQTEEYKALTALRDAIDNGTEEDIAAAAEYAAQQLGYASAEEMYADIGDVRTAIDTLIENGPGTVDITTTDEYAALQDLIDKINNGTEGDVEASDDYAARQLGFADAAEMRASIGGIRGALEGGISGMQGLSEEELALRERYLRTSLEDQEARASRILDSVRSSTGSTSRYLAAADSYMSQIRDTQIQGQLAIAEQDMMRKKQEFDGQMALLDRMLQSGEISSARYLDMLKENRSQQAELLATQIDAIIKQNSQKLQLYETDLSARQQQLDSLVKSGQISQQQYFDQLNEARRQQADILSGQIDTRMGQNAQYLDMYESEQEALRNYVNAQLAVIESEMGMNSHVFDIASEIYSTFDAEYWSEMEQDLAELNLLLAKDTTAWETSDWNNFIQGVSSFMGIFGTLLGAILKGV